MTALPFWQVLFAVAMLLSGRATPTKISASTTSGGCTGTFITWTKQSDGLWAVDVASKDTQLGKWSFDAGTMVVTVRDAASDSPESKTGSISKYLKIERSGEELPASIEMMGQTYLVTKKDKDLILTLKSDTTHYFTIHYEAGAGDAAAVTSSGSTSISARAVSPAASVTLSVVPSVAGKYVGGTNNETSAELNADGTFVFKEHGMLIKGKYMVDGNTLSLFMNEGDGVVKARIEGNTLVPVVGNAQPLVKQP